MNFGHFLISAWELITRLKYYPFTIGLLTSIYLASGLAHGLVGQLPAAWSANFGFAPSHLFSGDAARLVTSVFLTHDFQHLALATIMIIPVVGWTETFQGSAKTLALFAISHLISMLVFAIGISVLHALHRSSLMSLIYTFHDVGPSAGYYGCLGGSLVSSRTPLKRFIIAAAVSWLALRIACSTATMPNSQASLSADIVHLLALLTGMITIAALHTFYPRDRS